MTALSNAADPMAFGLAPKGSIRSVGEQIDGSFELDRAVYLIEASPERNNRVPTTAQPPQQPRSIEAFSIFVETAPAGKATAAHV
jgi:hypothetical protein